MEIIKEGNINRELKGKEFNWSFTIKKEGLYGIEITASAKSWWQNFLKLRSFFKDDDLTLKIDGISFPKKSSKRGLFDSEVAWNGNNLKGLKKTDFFIVKLQSCKYTLDFLVDQSPFLETIRICQIEESEISYLPKDNYPVEDGNRRQWLTIILVNLGLSSLKIKASAKEGSKFFVFKRDDSDLKLIINSEIQKNKEQKSHRNWFWCGRTLKGNSKTFEKQLNLKSDLYYIELWVDRAPEIEGIKIGLEKVLFLPKAKVVWKEVFLRKNPDTSSSYLAELEKGDTVFVLQKAIEGEAPYIEERNDRCNIWHEVKFFNKTGYIFSEALEIEGEDKESIIKKIIESANEKKIEAEITLSLAECESHFFPYSVSEDEAKGIFQLTSDLIKDLNNPKKPFYSPILSPFNIKENIAGGISYFEWLYREKFGDDSEKLRKAIVSYNAGPGSIPIKEKLKLDLYDSETQRLVNCIENHLKERTFNKRYLEIFKKIGFGFLIFAIVSFVYLAINDLFLDDSGGPILISEIFSGYEIFQKEERDSRLYREKVEEKIYQAIKEKNKKVELGNIVDDLDGDGKLDKISFSFHSPARYEYITTVATLNNSIDLDGSFYKAYIKNLDRDGQKELILELWVGAGNINTLIYKYRKGHLVFIPLVPQYLPLGFLGKTELIDYDDDGKLEIKVHYRTFLPSPCLQSTSEIYKYDGEKLVLFKKSEIDEKKCLNIQ